MVRLSRLSLLICILALSGSVCALACPHPEFVISGLRNTDEAWLRDYLDLGALPEATEQELARIRQKITTTDVFTAVEVRVNENAPPCQVLIEVKEKITRIPVVRGAYGGGTPLVILGGYETNAFGRLLAIGGEIRRYGDMAPGAFFFFKSPRAWRGRGLWGGELWLDRRRRAFFDADGTVYGFADSEAWTTKAQWLYPLSDDRGGSWQGGFQAQAFRESPTTFHNDEAYKGAPLPPPGDLILNTVAGFGGMVGPMLAYDSLVVDGLNLEGVKMKVTAGGARSVASSGGFSEAEVFTYARLPADMNLAARLFAGSTTQNTVGAVYYLGGFDSVRGLPDGVHYGNKTAFGNIEARVVAAKLKYAHIQPALFFDTGSAWMAGDNPWSGRETSMGGGVRIAVPQVYRLVLRIDYGVSIGHTPSRGWSIGLNQFFQPYKLVF